MTHRRTAGALVALAVSAIALLAPGTASAHSLASSSVTMIATDDGLDGTLVLAVDPLDQAFDADHRSDDLSPEAYAAQVVAYLDEHLTVRGADGVPWQETWGEVERQSTEGIETLTIPVAIDAGGADPADLAVTYDGVIEAVPDHEAVLVLERDGSVSTPGVFSADEPTIVVGDGTTSVAMTAMARFGFHHVLDGADHLLFLLTLLLPAPLVAVAGRWELGPGLRWSLRKVLHVVTAFTLGHSLTLAATALGWIRAPGRPVEVLIAASVAVSAIHAIRPLVRGGEALIAGTFGLVHGLAFAGILAELGLQGSTSVAAVLSFNVGIELAQLTATALVFPSLYLLSTRPGYDRVRVVGASLALIAASAWLVDRVGLVANPLAGVEEAIVASPWMVVVGLAALAALRLATRPRTVGERIEPTLAEDRPAVVSAASAR